MRDAHGIGDEQVLRQEAGLVELVFSVPADSDYFDGHFPDFKLLPAVAQFDIISRFARRYFKISHFIPHIRRVKFSSPVYPGSRVCLTMHLDRKKSSLSFELSDATVSTAEHEAASEHGGDAGRTDSGEAKLLSSGSFSVVLQDLHEGDGLNADEQEAGGQETGHLEAGRWEETP
ncbi:MAG: hypothetical protein J6Y13_02765 [Treponema sp.]|nr:hypothetical protein [Treponema sp.]